ncbi:GTPase ObgE [Mycoplasmopsis pullorum]|uniref:GTPase ObgE n=1 Tax=Mycoplasmopsis pullorum TaxID=48003 RepID=UPI001117C1E0|nr:GTPase ObgE [Mycoplasmopsis pullorum]TNK81836.1 GTPase ObgE [Mycoplasmopsis pullorum]TNK82716.1 GTPase ObgE [Mycoplasmopsis pullorum]TNK84204.1 GTPase ObgE [Mycoplasmopsis pullorum]TNK85355.1 GTPase ObgE [Mycoplasmopsis pullorum]TNK85474.1 GTPase ObgE [Mycoplasmopsis pullorum]
MARFIDEVYIQLKAGKGGDGMISFRREAHVDKGGPDGGDGGRGGNIYFVADPGKNTLLSFYKSKHITAKDGVKGGPKNLYGANAEDTYIKVPVGTLVYNKNKLVADIIEENKPYLVAAGGKGGRGNTKFKTSRNTAPRICENGLPGEKYEARIVLKILSDVGVVGKPSAGKSTFLSVISNAKAKIADYDFTTLVPQLGMVEYHENSFTVADLPGLIKGASLGKGLGIQFLKHIERCRVIAHIIDFGSEEKNPIEDYEVINNELKNYDLKLEKKTQVIIANKSDLPSFEKHFEEFSQKYPDLKVIKISAINKENLNSVKDALWNAIIENKATPVEEQEDPEITIEYEPDYEISIPYRGHFEITGKKVEELYHKIPLNSYDNLLRFNNILKKIGVWDELIKNDIAPGDTVRIYGYEFQWEDEE